jgi:Domain of Unknown Function with PDB structure (DUF3857)
MSPFFDILARFYKNQSNMIRLTRFVATGLSFIFLVSAFNCIAQTNVSDFSVFTPEEIALKECSFDKTADAMILFDQATSNYNDEYNLVTERRIRFKVLKEKGIDRGNIHIRFYSKDKFEFIHNVKAIIATPDQNGNMVWSNLEQKSVYTRKLNELYSEEVFAMPNVKVGSIIEYQYESVKEHYGGLDDWYFQREIPTLLSSYKLYILPNAVFNYAVKKSNFLNINIEPHSSDGYIVFEMHNVPGLRDEEYSTSYRDYLQRVSFQLSSYNSRGVEMKFSNNWKELNRDLIEDKGFGGQINKNLSGLEPAKALWANRGDAYDKMKFIYDYVRRNFEWNEIYSMYASDGLKSVVEKKHGNSAELNLLLINLLKDANLDVYPLLASERSHGNVDTSISFLDQFNKIVALVNIDNKRYILDATDELTPVSMIPSELLNTIAFVVDKKNFGFIHLIDNSKKKVRIIYLEAAVEPSGSVKGSAGVSYSDYARIGKAEQYNSNKQEYLSQFASSVTDLKIDSFKIAGLETDTVQLHHDLNFEYSLSRSGNYHLLSYNLFTGFEKNPFIADYRFTDIDFGTKYTYTFYGTFTIPDQLAIDALPKNMTLITPDKGLQAIREIKKNANTVEVSMRIDFAKSRYDADDYSILKDFFSKMIDMLNEPVVLKDK